MRRRAREERRQTANFKEAACCPPAVVHGAARRKMISVKGVSGVNGTLGKANSHFVPTQAGSGTSPPR